MKNDIVIFGGAFNPPGRHHEVIALRLSKIFSWVIVYPSCPGSRPDKQDNYTDPKLIMEMCRLSLGNIANNISLDFYDLLTQTFTSTIELQRRFEKSGQELWHAVGADWLSKDKIYQWVEGEFLFNNSNFVIITRPGFEIDKNNLPPRHKIIEIKTVGSSTDIRNAIRKGESFSHLVCDGVGDIITRNGLYL